MVGTILEKALLASSLLPELSETLMIETNGNTKRGEKAGCESSNVSARKPKNSASSVALPPHLSFLDLAQLP